MASGRGLGGAARGRGALPMPACRQKCSGGGAVGSQGGLSCCGKAGSAWRGPAVWAKTGARRGGSCARLQFARSGRAQRTHTRCSAKCNGMLGGSVGAGS